MCVYIYILTKTGYRLASSTDASILTPGHAPVPSLAGPQHAVHKVHAKRKMRDRAFVESLHQVRNHLTATSELAYAHVCSRMQEVRKQLTATYADVC